MPIRGARQEPTDRGFIGNWIAMRDAVSDARTEYERNRGPRTW
jgi:hypothetical protein